jgi:ADP-ribosylglycohydrolase
MKDPTGRTDAMLNSLHGLWVGDCIGNIGQLYFAHDILKALDEGIMKFGADNIPTNHQHFQYSDDTEEAIVLVNHLYKNGSIKQDELAKEFATRYYDRDPDGELYGYGLMTRKVLKDIYDGVDWRVANQTKPRIEGPSFVDKMLGNIVGGKSINQSMAEVNVELKEHMKKDSNMRIGSCGNGSAMRVAPLGAWLVDEYLDKVIEMAKLQSEVTHCHPEGIAGAIVVTLLARQIALMVKCSVFDVIPSYLYNILLRDVPTGQVWDGIKKASELPLDTPIYRLIKILGNGTHVTCQDTIPLCVFLTIRALTQYKIEEMYEKVMIETCKCFGDVDTNCAIVGGMIGIISSPPAKWVRYCQPMEGVLGEPFPEKPRKPTQSKLGFDIDKSAIADAMGETQPWGIHTGVVRNLAAEAEYHKWLAQMETKPFIPNTGSCEAVSKMPPSFSSLIEQRFPGKTYRL